VYGLLTMLMLTLLELEQTIKDFLDFKNLKSIYQTTWSNREKSWENIVGIKRDRENEEIITDIDTNLLVVMN